MNRSRVTITLQDELLRQIDRLIDGTRVKNRSHAIESLLLKELGERRLTTAVILAGGRGIAAPGGGRMSRVLAPYRGGLFLEHVFAWLRREGIEEVIIGASELTAGIEAKIGAGDRYGLHVTYLPADRGTAGVLRHLVNRLPGTFLMMNGDVLAEASLSEMLAFHRQQRAVCTLALTSVPAPAAFGNIVLQGNRITDFIEKPKAGEEESYLINAGLYLMEPEIFNALSPRHLSLEKDLFPALAKAGKLGGYFLPGEWVGPEQAAAELSNSTPKL